MIIDFDKFMDCLDYDGADVIEDLGDTALFGFSRNKLREVAELCKVEEKNHYVYEVGKSIPGSEEAILSEEKLTEIKENLNKNVKREEYVKVVRGQWELGHYMMTCSNCCNQFDKIFKHDYLYYPNCGAKMVEVSE